MKKYIYFSLFASFISSSAFAVTSPISIEECGKLLPVGHTYSIFVNAEIDRKTNDKDNMHGDITATDSDGHSLEITDEQTKSFIQCALPLIRHPSVRT